MKIQYASTSSFIILNSVGRDTLCSVSALQGYLNGVLRKKQLIASFVEQFQLTLENTGCFEFPSHVAKLSQ